MSTDQPALYRIRIEGLLDPSWSERMAGMAIEADEAETAPVTILTGELIDQSALHGVLNTLLELHMPILSTERLAGPERTN
ncbi:MAG: hypothetical protein GY778_29415 [bacterium]|nr:hypothetical protein [bacterium]